jgi:hypothetical protein
LNFLILFQKKQDKALASSGGSLRAGKPRDLEFRKRKEYLKHMTEVISTLEHVFAMASSIRKVLISVGSTIVTPKETYLIQFPTSIHEGKILSLKHCKTALFRQLLASPFFVDIQAPKSCTRVQILLEMPEGSNYDLPIIPKPTYKPSPRGSHLTLQFVCNSNEVSGELSRISDTAFDISGIEALNHSVIDPDVLLRRRLSSVSTDELNMSVSHESLAHSTPFCPIDRLGRSSQNSDCTMETESTPTRSMSPMLISDVQQDQGADMDSCSIDQMEYTWYQLDTSIQGYKDKTTTNS